MTSYEYTSAPRAVSVLPENATRRLTRRDALLPLVLALELLAGIAFGVAGHSGSSGATSVPAKLTLGPPPLVTVSPALTPVASVSAALPRTLPRTLPSIGPVAPGAEAPSGPAVGPLLPGTVRGPLPVDIAPVAPVAPVAPAAPAVEAPPPPYPTHAPRDPFAALVTVKP